MTPGPDRPEGDLRISTDPADVDITWLVPALSERSYWARGRGRTVVERSIAGSLVFGAYDGDRQVAFARVVTDMATFAWICDVFVDESARGRGVGKRLMGAVLADPRLQGLKRMLLATDTAASFYAEMGFETLEHPEKWMQRVAPTAAAAGRDDR
jgi:N-acetylglutamate synthase-like GNAT family acetyltransferase